MMQRELAGKAAMVTGAARGQGRAIALALAAAGADVAICDVGAATMPSVGYSLGGALDEVAREIEAHGVKALAMACDVRDQAQIDAFVTATLAAFGRLDILVNNAGILTGHKPAHELDDAMWTTMIDINLTGAWRMARAVLPQMIARGQGGRIVNIASVAGHVGTPGFAHYCAPKHGLMGLTRSMSGELAPHNITVNALAPSRPIATPGLRYYRSELATTSPEDEFAGAAVELALVTPDVVTGRTIGHLQVLDGSFAEFTDVEQAMA